MRQLRRVLIATQNLVWFVAVLVVVTVPLKFEEKVVGYSMRSIPRVSYSNLLVASVWVFLPCESIVFNIVDEF